MIEKNIIFQKNLNLKKFRSPEKNKNSSRFSDAESRSLGLKKMCLVKNAIYNYIVSLKWMRMKNFSNLSVFVSLVLLNPKFLSNLL